MKSLPPKGRPMPQTPDQFKRMGDLYEKALLEARAENARLRVRVHDLEQRLSRIKKAR